MRSRNWRKARGARPMVSLPMMWRGEGGWGGGGGGGGGFVIENFDVLGRSGASDDQADGVGASVNRCQLDGRGHGLPPEVRQGVRRRVVRAADAEMRSDALAQDLVDLRHAAFAVHLDEVVPLREIFEFALDHRLVADEGLEEVVGERHIAAGFPVADGLRFLKFAIEADFGADVQPEGEIRAERRFVNSVEVIASDTADGGAGDEGEDVTVGEDDQAGAQRGQDAAFELVEKVGAVHQGESHVGNGVFGEEAVDVFADEIGAAQTHGLHREAFGFEPFGEERDLSGTAGAVGAFDDHESATEFFGFYARQRRAVEARQRFGRRGFCGFCGLGPRRCFRRFGIGRSFFFWRHCWFFGAYCSSEMRSPTIWRISFWSLLTRTVPSIRTKLSLSTMAS